MATLAELQDALVNADKAGDTAAARQLADAIYSMQQTQEAKPTAVKAGEALQGIPRQLGLTARYALEGLAQLGEVGTEPIRRLVTDPLLGVQTKPLSQQASGLADRLGLPTPQGANERVVGDASRLVAGSAGVGSLAQLARSAPGVAGQFAQMLSSNLGQQAIAAGGAGLAGGSVREAGGGPWQQAGAAMLGGVAAPMAVNAVSNAGNRATAAIKNLVAPQVVQREVDQQINLVLRQQGIDWAQIPERIKQPMREEARRAMATGGELNPEALRRLLDFQTVGATPTRGMLTQDPVALTREKNLAKTGANSTDIALNRLSRLENENVNRLLGNLDEMGAGSALEAPVVGERSINALAARVRNERGVVDSLYSSARDTSGRSAPLDGQFFTARANQLLDQELVGGSLPPDVASHLNRIARGEVPFTVDYAEQLKTRIGNLQRNASDGGARMALGIVRRALDDTPLQSAPKVNPGNLPTVPGTVPQSPAVLGEESINAFNQARQANRQLMQRLEANPALKAVDEAIAAARSNPQLGSISDIVGAPDFAQKYVLSGTATPRQVEALVGYVGPEGRQALRDFVLSHLRGAATNNTDDIAKFSPDAYNKALRRIGERKLATLFDAEEIRRLQAVGRTGTLMKAQPDGSAVNNSNSGALLLGRGLDMLDSVAGKLPLGVDTTIQGILRGTQQGQAMNVPNALMLSQPQAPLVNRLGAAAMYGGLLASQPVYQP